MGGKKSIIKHQHKNAWGTSYVWWQLVERDALQIGTCRPEGKWGGGGGTRKRIWVWECHETN